MVTGVDVVREQVRIATGDHLSVGQEDVRAHGHAIECRIYAEDPSCNFLPSVGTVTRFRVRAGPGVRVDSGVETGSPVTMYYDPLLCKVVAWDRARPAANARMRRALTELVVEG